MTAVAITMMITAAAAATKYISTAVPCPVFGAGEGEAVADVAGVGDVDGIGDGADDDAGSTAM